MTIKQLQNLLFSTLFVLAFVQLNTAYASIETYPFESAEQEQDYKILIDELRCMVCQNQNLADSNAELAQDLRKQIHTMVVEKSLSRDEVVDYMVDRYGDFVLYKPPVKSHTYLLWAGPFLFLLLGFWMAYRTIKQSNTTTEKEER